MEETILLKRLSAIKLLYRHGIELSRQSEVTAHFSILAFHDSIEIFLKLAADTKVPGKDTSNYRFIQYWKEIPELTLKGQMETLNAHRRTIKHSGLTLGKLEIESDRIHVTDFFNENTPIIFGLNFNNISLFDLITFAKTKKLLKASQEALDNRKIEVCIKCLTEAFYELMFDYKDSKSGRSYTNFDFVEQISHPNIRFRSGESDRGLEEIVEKLTDKINKNFENIGEALEIVSLGLDYRKYIKFKILTPATHRFPDGKYVHQIYGEKNWTKENCQFLIDFVLDSALKLQDFDFDFDSLDLTKSIFREVKM